MLFPRDLTDLSPKRQQEFVDYAINGRRHWLRWAAQNPRAYVIDCGPNWVANRWMFNLVEIVELGPPSYEAGDWIDLTEPPFLPIWVCRGDGKRVIVWSEAELKQELARQPQCYGPTPDGPWYGDSADPWPYPWKEATKGPFAPPPASYLEQYRHFPPGGDHAVFAPHPLFYNDQMLCAGVIFTLEVPSKDYELLQKGTVIKVPSYAQPIKYAPTGWWVVDQPMFDNYAQRYESGDLTGMQWTGHSQPDTVREAERAALLADARRKALHPLDELLIKTWETLQPLQASRAEAQRILAAKMRFMAIKSSLPTPVSSLQDLSITLPNVDVRPQDTAPTAEPVRPVHNSKRHASKGGRHPLPQRDLDRFQKDLRELVYQHVDTYGDDEPLTETMVLQRWKGKMTEAMLTLRLKRTGEQWHCKGWREIFLYIKDTRS